MVWHDIMAWITVPCLHCGTEKPMRDYHHSFQMMKNEYYLRCPACHEVMILGLTTERKEGE
jgi:hypothetical protein